VQASRPGTLGKVLVAPIVGSIASAVGVMVAGSVGVGVRLGRRVLVGSGAFIDGGCWVAVAVAVSVGGTGVGLGGSGEGVSLGGTGEGLLVALGSKVGSLVGSSLGALVTTGVRALLEAASVLVGGALRLGTVVSVGGIGVSVSVLVAVGAGVSVLVLVGAAVLVKLAVGEGVTKGLINVLIAASVSVAPTASEVSDTLSGAGVKVSVGVASVGDGSSVGTMVTLSR